MVGRRKETKMAIKSVVMIACALVAATFSLIAFPNATKEEITIHAMLGALIGASLWEEAHK